MHCVVTVVLLCGYPLPGAFLMILFQTCPLKFHPTPLECSFYVWLPFTRYVFKRLKFLGNRQASWALTMLFMGLWHGVWPGYYINFSLEMLAIMAERTVSKDPFLQSGHVTRLLNMIVWWERQKIVTKIKAIDLVFCQNFVIRKCALTLLIAMMQVIFDPFRLEFL